MSCTAIPANSRTSSSSSTSTVINTKSNSNSVVLCTNFTAEPETMTPLEKTIFRRLSTEISPILLRDLLTFRVLLLYSPFLQGKDVERFFPVTNLPQLDVKYILFCLESAQQTQTDKNKVKAVKSLLNTLSPGSSDPRSTKARVIKQTRQASKKLNITIPQIIASLKLLQLYNKLQSHVPTITSLLRTKAIQHATLAAIIADDLAQLSAQTGPDSVSGLRNIIAQNTQDTGLSVQAACEGIKMCRDHFFETVSVATVVEYRHGKETVGGRSVTFKVRNTDSVDAVCGGGQHGGHRTGEQVWWI